MRIALNLLYLLPGIVGGTETYAAGLLHGLAQVDEQNEYLVFVNRESAEWPIPEATNFRRVICPVSATRRAARYLFEQCGLPLLIRRHCVDVVHSMGYVSPLLTPCPAIVTIHDLNYRAFGQGMFLHRRGALGFFVKRSALHAWRVIAVSDFARLEIEQAFRLPPNRVVVIPEAATTGSCPGTGRLSDDELRRLGIVGPYILAFSSTTPNKNIPRLLQAYGIARSQYGVTQQLVLVGHAPNPSVLEGWAARGADGVLFTGYLDEPRLQVVLGHAQLLVFPSIYEGFGLPILEAMAAGVPVVSSTSASMPEVAGDAALYFDPYSVEEMAQKIAQVLFAPSLREALKEKGTRNLERFSWEKTARATVTVYEEAASWGR